MEKDLDPVQAWDLEKSEPGPELVLFRARFDWVKNPRNQRKLKAVILESPDWVNVVALTPQGKVLVVRQYRFGVRKTTVEIPAGLIEPGETPTEAAARELAEETGYTSDQWESLGWVDANPAFLDNRCHLWLAKNVIKTRATHLDESEALVMEEMSEDQLKTEIMAGRMRNTYSLLALARVFDLRYPGLSY